MTITIGETYFSPRTSRRLDQPSERAYLVQGATALDEVYAAVEGYAPALTDGKPIHDIRADIIETPSGTDWRVRVIYQASGGGNIGPPGADGTDYGGTTGATATRRFALETKQTATAVGFEAPDLGGAINATAGAINGVDIVVRQQRLGFRVRRDDLPAAYRVTLFNATGRINSLPISYRSVLYDAGELLYLGADWVEQEDGSYVVDHGMLAEPNVTGLFVGGLGPVSKRGHDYVSLYTEETQVGDAVVQQPRALHVYRVYDEVDFSALEIDL